jgi:LPXTG-motif cell wall-anchored protein
MSQTGFDAFLVILTALVLISIGTVLLAGSRRRRHST